jgi:hypothetical protein
MGACFASGYEVRKMQIRFDMAALGRVDAPKANGEAPQIAPRRFGAARSLYEPSRNFESSAGSI